MCMLFKKDERKIQMDVRTVEKERKTTIPIKRNNENMCILVRKEERKAQLNVRADTDKHFFKSTNNKFN